MRKRILKWLGGVSLEDLQELQTQVSQSQSLNVDLFTPVLQALDRVERKIDILIASDHQREARETREAPAPGAIHTTRPSWPRMRRLLEEDDIRAMRQQVDQNEAYWREKDRRVNEGRNEPDRIDTEP